MTTVPSHVPIPLYRPWVVETASPVPFLASPSDLAVPVSGALPARQRRKLWELASHLYCSIVGTCLSTTELRKVVAKFKGHELKGFSDLAIHEEAVKAAGHHDDAGRLLHKALDRRHEATLKRFQKAQDTDAVRLLWEEAQHSGDIPGAYWAVLTHWASTPELIKAAFADVHMLSHLVGAANRADIRRLAALEAERAALALQVEKQQTQLREGIVARDATIRRLNSVLAEHIAQERRAVPAPCPQEPADENLALRELVVALQHRLDTEVTRRERAEQRHGMLHAALSEAQTTLRHVNRRPSNCVMNWRLPKHSSRLPRARTQMATGPCRPISRALDSSMWAGVLGTSSTCGPLSRPRKRNGCTTMVVWRSAKDCSPEW